MPFLTAIALLALQNGLTNDVKIQTIDALFANMKTDYVFPEIATKAEAAVRAKLAAHEYDGITDGKAFATQLTSDLRDVCHDAHLHVSFSEEALPTRAVATEPSKDEIAQQKFWAKKRNGGFRKVELLSGNIGYIRFDGFMSPQAAKEPLRAAMQFVADSDALIFDMRSNGGGDPEMVQLVCSYLFDKKTHLNDLYFRKSNQTIQFWTLPKVDGKRYLNREVYILTGKRTGSAAEEFSYNLKNLKRATLVGDSTWGGANPGDDVRLNDHFHAFVPQGRAINPITKTNWEGTGVEPDIKVSADDALGVAHKTAVEHLLADPKNAELKPALEEVLKRLATTKE